MKRVYILITILFACFYQDAFAVKKGVKASLARMDLFHLGIGSEMAIMRNTYINPVFVSVMLGDSYFPISPVIDISFFAMDNHLFHLGEGDYIRSSLIMIRGGVKIRLPLYFFIEPGFSIIPGTWSNEYVHKDSVIGDMKVKISSSDEVRPTYSINFKVGKQIDRFSISLLGIYDLNSPYPQQYIYESKMYDYYSAQKNINERFRIGFSFTYSIL